MQTKKSLWHWDLVLVAFIISILDIGLAQYFQDILHEELFGKIFTDLLLVITAWIVGKRYIAKAGFPLWWKRNNSISILKQLLFMSMLGLAIIIPNTLIYYANQNLTDVTPWLNFSSLKDVIFLALRAGLQEEILFRLFIFPTTVYLAGRVITSEKSKMLIGVLITSLIFGLMHGGVNIPAIVFGAILAYTYYKNGLVPVIIIHFLANAIPWILLYMQRLTK